MIDVRKALGPSVGLSMGLAVILAGPAIARPLDPTTRPPAGFGQPVGPETLDDAVARLNLALSEGRREDGLAIVEVISTRADFPMASDQVRLATFYLIGILNLEMNRPGAAVAPLVTATGMTGATAQHWIRRIDAEERSGNGTAAAHSLAQLIRQFPEALEDMDPGYPLYLATDPDMDPAAGVDLRAALFDSNWHHTAESTVWGLQVDDLLALGEIDQARRVLERISEPSDLIRIRALHRYDVLTNDLPPIDIPHLLARDLEADRLGVATPNPEIGAYKTLAFALFSRGQLSEALTTTDVALARPEPDAGTAAWRDRTWLMDTRARTLMALGRGDEAAVQSQAAAARIEEGRADLSQTINLGWLYLRLDRNADAMATTVKVDENAEATFDTMLTIQIRACAASALGDGPAAEAAYAYLAANWRVAPRAVMDALLCRGDVDGAAAVMVQRLDDPELAATALAELHHHLPAPAPTPFDTRLIAGDAIIAARPDVIAARDRVGRLFHIPTLALF